jgi:glycosyltransferase involved in cell wall biosynthesis
MALGTPVVGYAHSGLAEYVEGAGGGRTVAPGAEALAAAAAEIHDDRDLWLRLSESAAAAVARRHSPAAYAARIAEVYAACNGSRAA